MPAPSDPIPDALLDTLTDVAHEAASAAAAVLADRFGHTTADVGTKSSPTDMVSDADRAAETSVGEIITARRPDDAMLGEEGTSRPGTTGVRWVVDPLDGTTNYLYGVPAFGVSVAAEIAGRTVVGVVADPARGETWAATRGRGATLNDRPLQLAPDTDGLQRALVATGFSYLRERRATQAALLATILPAVRDIRRFGAAAIDLCWVAGGRVSAFYEWGLAPWDHAAGALIATESGAEAATLPDGTMLCAAPGLFAPLRDLLERAASARSAAVH